MGGSGGMPGAAGGAKSTCRAGTVLAAAQAGIPSIHTIVCGVSCPLVTICRQASRLYGPYCWPFSAKKREMAGTPRGGGGVPMPGATGGGVLVTPSVLAFLSASALAF